MAAAMTPSSISSAFAELEKQRDLIASCTLLYKDLSDHFSSLERDLQLRSDLLLSKRKTLDLSADQTLASLRRRELSIDRSVEIAISNLNSLISSVPSSPVVPTIRSLAKQMDPDAFLDLVVSKRKDSDFLRSEIPLALSGCVDPSKLVLDVMSRIFPVDKRKVKSPPDLAWACVLILEGLVPALEDPEIGKERLLVTRVAKERARKMAEEWKEGMEGRGGVGGLKPADVHSFLQLVVTFGVAEKEDRMLYRKLVVGYAWRKQMPKLAVSLGLDEDMPGIKLSGAFA